MRMVAVVLGGGVGQRLGAGMPKQLLTLGGTTLIERCVAAFEAAPGVDEILVVMARGYTVKVEALLAEGGYRKVTGVIEGGRTRPDSTRAALAAIAAGAGGDVLAPGGTTPPNPPEDCGVLLHDAARPPGTCRTRPRAASRAGPAWRSRHGGGRRTAPPAAAPRGRDSWPPTATSGRIRS